MADTEFCWLIEAPGPRYLMAEQWQSDRKFKWTSLPQEALRFYNERQANNAMMAIRQLDQKLFGFEFPLGVDAKPTEHGFMEPRP